LSDNQDDTQFNRPSIRFPRRLQFILVIVVALFLIWIIAGQSINVWLNLIEFGDLFIYPIYFSIIGGLILGIIALVRIDVRNRRSITWWAIRLAIKLIRGGGEVTVVPPNYFDFKRFKLSPVKFFLWQITKVLIGIAIFNNILFGLTISAMFNGWDPSLGAVGGIFGLSFASFANLDASFAQTFVLPAMPALTLFIAPLITAFSARLLILVGATNIIRVVTPTIEEISGEPRAMGWRIATVEALAALALFWIMFTTFFPSYIDYNTKILIGGFAALGSLFLVFALVDWKGKGIGLLKNPRNRIVPIVLVVIIIFGAIFIQNGIAGPQKIAWQGPYTSQEISVNRYLAELDKVTEIDYNFSLVTLPENQINAYVTQQKDILDKIRLWDWDAGFAKLKPDIGLIPYIEFQDSDIVRFNGSLYWSASMKPVLPSSVEAGNTWYAEHFVYTHVPEGFLLLDADDGSVQDSNDFFNQRRIYYGESGLLQETWAGYPVDRIGSEEITDHAYGGLGGLDLPPPLSWLFETNFLISFPEKTIHVLRYQDVYDRMNLLFPYFIYEFGNRPVDMFPVTDGEDTYYMMPLIVALRADNVPWSGGNPFLRLFGYSLINVYTGEIQILVLGDDFFSELFKEAYGTYVTTEIPDWLTEQTRYPEELYEWRVSMYNSYHVTDPSTFINGGEFYEVPAGLNTYYIMAKPPDFEEPEFVGLLSLERRGAITKNLAGYMVIRNEIEHLGEMNFYEIPLDGELKLLGPSAAQEALGKNSEYAQLKTLLESAGGVREGDNILYRVGDHDVYFIPVYTAPAGGVIAELGIVSAVGATFTGVTFVGLGTTAEEAFTDYLANIAGIDQPPITPDKDLEQRKQDIFDLFGNNSLTIVEPIVINPVVSFFEGSANYTTMGEWPATEELVDDFIEKWGQEAEIVLMWSEESKTNFGVLVSVSNIAELHFITIEFT
jgi:uncharacterized membrane protein (UPF0182 family)